MPAPLNVNREAVKTLAIAIGVRQAARKMGLPEKTVLAWSHRDNWFPEDNARHERSPIINGQKTVQSSAVRSPSDALSLVISNASQPTRAALAKAHRKAAEYAAKLTGRSLLDKDTAQAVKSHGQGAALVHGWDVKERDQAQVAVNIAILGS